MTTTDWIQAISAGIAALVTIVLARITYIYVRETRRIAKAAEEQSKIMHREFEIRLMPLVEEKMSPRITGIPKPTVDLTILNKGVYPVFCINIEIKLINNNNKEELNLEPLNILQWLEGGHEMPREITLDFTRLPSFSRSLSIKGEAVAIMTFNYRTISNTEMHQIKSVNF